MTIEDLYRDITAIVPLEPVHVSNFRDALNKSLNSYFLLVKEYFDTNNVNYACESLAKITIEIRRIKDFVKDEYKGIHVSVKRIKNFQKDLPFNLYDIPVNTSLYRIRVEENRNGLDYTQMFHYPLTKRNKIKMQRYSFPGYPCLYLGMSIYACWEEMNRPLFDKCMVSLFKNSMKLTLIDLSVPVVKDFTQNTRRYIESFPIIIACLFQVFDSNSYFKPEYIFPQFIMQLVISNKELDGILYTTTHYNKDFKFTYDKFLNVAIPVKEPLTKGDNCPKLSSMFTLTDATCYEFENLKGKEEARTSITWTEIGGDEKAENYKASKFSRLEECLQTFEMKSLS